MQVPEAKMQVPGGDNSGPIGDLLWPDLMSVGEETLSEKIKANGTVFDFILTGIFISAWPLSLTQ